MIFDNIGRFIWILFDKLLRFLEENELKDEEPFIMENDPTML